MILTLNRFASNRTDAKLKATFGELLIDGKHAAYTLEDMYQPVKIHGETRIPAGTYKILFRTDGEKSVEYQKKYPAMHKGMLWLQNIPDFQYVYIHVGNYPKDTLGCILVGEDADVNKGMITRSGAAYIKIYPIVAGAIECGEEVTITINDEVIA